jgi:2-keto-4-pentenoate hydratase/2-oxohepta-3-ene-1,7-dioic acid hydratase in catechol pathway
MSDRHWQTDQNGNLTQVVTAKSFDTFAPLGPMLVTPDEIDDPDSLQIKLWVNDELRQDFNSREYIYGVDEAIEFCSQFFTLFPGDIISMGSGPGNAFFWKKYLEVGDRVKATIDGLGVQAFSIAAEA